MPALRFHISELVRETRTLQRIAREFLDPVTTWALDQFNSRLEAIWGLPEDEVRLELSPLRTRPNQGAHEAGDRRGGNSVIAVISGGWDVVPLGPSRHRPKRELAFTGLASTKVELYNSGDDCTRLAMWRLESGDSNSPGCHFHAQILGDSVQPPFPSSIPIPRLPSHFVSPMSAIEYVLGEMFQDEWARETASGTSDALRWRGLQRRRLQCLFSWYQKAIENPDSSPWMNLKAAKPDASMFTN